MLFIADVVISDQPFHLSLQVLPQIRQVHIYISIIYVSMYLLFEICRGRGAAAAARYTTSFEVRCVQTDRQRSAVNF